ncbi:hypothetical protein [Flavobacterium sp. LB2P53]|uniref:hypothetical protein n=1 Tax=Flavobacterium sp. LB2P53 TaxID=2497481 RepID=UPI000F84713C|nr:hypothetical protein [Flavobacterium sp. LB2P53]RTY69679.1 hypothetical protein EKL95_05820 [Flavobacterium sp. LB2P53]
MQSSKKEELLAEKLINSISKLLVKNLIRSGNFISENELIDRIAERVFELQNEVAKKECELHTSKEICIIYKISPATLERWIRKGLKYESTGVKSKRYFTIKNIEIFKTKKR